jgi:hypothetical protein
MQNDEKTKPRLEIAHVLFIDIVEYSKMLTNEQSEALQELNQIVRNTEAVRGAQAAGPPFRSKFSVFATTLCHGLSLSR